MAEEVGNGSTKPAWLISADRPINRSGDDAFGRAPFAAALARQLRRLRPGESYVVGLQGAWGAGKTSILNMIAEELEGDSDVWLVQFNPWLFSGTHQLAACFFQEVAAQLQSQGDQRLQKAGAAMVRYGDALSPLGEIPFVGAVAKGISSALKMGGDAARESGGALEQSISAQKKQIESLLLESPRRLLVVVDDIDRLSKQEIRDLFRLVRLTADFPNVSYLLSFDRVRVEEALSDRPGEGREYLEKILQLSFDLPEVRETDLTKFFLSELESALESMEHGYFDEAEWANVFHLVIRPLLHTPRDARRLANAVPTAVLLAGAEVALVDLLALEAIRVLLPDVFAQISACADLLTRTDSDRDYGAEKTRERFEALLSSAGEREGEVRELCRRIFPPSRRWIDNHHYGANWLADWRKNGRLAHPEVLKFYLEKGLPSSVLGERVIQEILGCLGSEAKLKEQLGALDAEALEQAIGRLETYEEDFSSEVASIAVPVFLNEGDRLREEKRGMFDFGSNMAVSRIALRLLRAVPQDDMDECVMGMMGAITSLSKKRMLVDLVGYADGNGHKLVTEECAAALYEEVRAELLDASKEQLIKERELWQLLLWADDGSTQVPDFLKAKLDDDRFALQLFRSGVSERHTMGMGDVASRKETTLPWEYLSELVGEKNLRTAVLSIVQNIDSLVADERDRLAVETAQVYVGGWRPDRDGYFAPSESLDERKYAEYILVNLLESGVPAKRKTAFERLRELNGRDKQPPRSVVEKLTKIATNSEIVANERRNAIDLIEGTPALSNIESTLMGQLLADSPMEDGLASKIAFLFRDRPAVLLDSLEAVPMPPAEEMASRFNTVLQAVAASLMDNPAGLEDDLMQRAVEISRRFESLELCGPAVERIQQAFEGEAR